MKHAETVGDGGTPPRDEPGGALRKGQTVGRYVIDRRVGSGGMGVVYLAFDPELDRRVAIKVLRTDLGETADERRQSLRLVREAQAQARLSHQNLTTVLDVGTTDDGSVFVTMEYIDGWNMRQWLDEHPRPWQQILDVFIEAGRGLVAAHKTGLIHRDFKPQNVLIGRDREVRVTDFGLARALDRDEVDPGASFSGEDALAVQLTHTGAMLGTPYYMAPEQHAGGDTDERTDQFSFCVSLWEALYDEHPYGGKSAPEIAERIRAGALREPVRRWIPDWLHLDLARGLKANPADRYESMQDLLDSLTRDRTAARRRVWSIAASVVALAALAVIGYQRFAAPAPTTTSPSAVPTAPGASCDGADQAIGEAWNDRTRAAGQAAFAATGADGAADAWTWTAGRIDAIASHWRDLARAACERNDDGARRCLQRRAIEVAAVADVLAAADAQTAARAVDVTSAIGPLTDCENAELTRPPLGPPSDAAADKAAALRADIARARARARGGSADRTAIDDAIAEVVELEYDALVSEAKLVRAEILLAQGQLDAAERDLHAATAAAIASDHLGAEVESFVGQMQVARARGDEDAALLWARYATAAEARAGDGDVRHGQLALAHARALVDAGAREGALVHFGAAAETFRRRLGETHPWVTAVAVEHARALLAGGDRDGARKILARAKASYLPPAVQASRDALVAELD